jgi:hypothetical protein
MFTNMQMKRHPWRSKNGYQSNEAESGFRQSTVPNHYLPGRQRKKGLGSDQRDGRKSKQFLGNAK